MLAVAGFFLLFAGNPPGTAASQAEVPGVPSNIQVQLGHSGELVASWSAPDSDGGSAITGYRVQWKEAADSWDTPASVSETMVTGMSHTISGLTDGTEYTVRIIAVNGIGDGPPSSEETCPGGYDPDPTPVEVEAVPIVVESTTEEYFVLYVKHDLDGTEVELPVSVTLGQDGTTTLAENVEALPAERYRVEKYLIADPADVDGDCVDDITELGNLGNMNPVNPAAAIIVSLGVVAVPDQETLDALSVAHNPRSFEGRLYVRFVLFDADTDRPGVYFLNTNTHQGHQYYLNTFGFERESDGMILGMIIYDPELLAPDGSPGVYLLHLTSLSSRDYYSFSHLERPYALLAASVPLLDDNLAFYVPNSKLPYIQSDLPLYRESRIGLFFEEDVFSETDFLALNPGEGYGRLRVIEPDERPNLKDIVIYEALPNELPRVAGIISTVPQTPLSHVNLRAVQDGVPNSFIRDALDNTDIDDLIDSYVHYTVTEDGWTLAAATPAEVDAHYASSRPATEQTPQRDLSVTEITPLGDIGFEDWTAFGVKAANVAVLGTLGFPEGTVPDGFAVPFYFYDEFMKHNELYDDIEEMLADPDFQTDFDVQEDELKDLRKAIKKGETPEWIIEALTEMHATYSDGQSLRYRSSTNNEDLPGFNGAGLYDSKTQHPEETEEDGIAKSLKQVYASLWNFRAFTERDFHRIDHLAAAMGVLVHPNYSDELANGVAVSFDPFTSRECCYYVNTQIGEDLVTNPDAHSVPEEVLLRQNGHNVLATSNQVEPGQLLMSDDQMSQLRQHLTVIHEEFKKLYNPAPGEPFAMEIEFKITSVDILAIKQARPWVFSPNNNTRATGLPIISGTAQVGETLTASISGIDDADGLDNAIFSYQWLADEVDMAGATTSSYTLTDADKGKTFRVRVTFADDRDHQSTLTSAATAAVEPNRLMGTAIFVGGVDLEWTDVPGAESYEVQLFRNVQWIDLPGDGVEIAFYGAGAIISQLNHDGYSYWFQVRANNAKGSSEWSDPYLMQPTNHFEAGRKERPENVVATGAPAISGTAQVGKVLTADASAIEDGNGLNRVKFQYQWVSYDGTTDTDIEGATESAYRLQAAEEGKTLKVRVSFTDRHGYAESVTSAETATVLAAAPNVPPNVPPTGAPTISGPTHVSGTLTASVQGIDDQNGLRHAAFRYRWTATEGTTDTVVQDSENPIYVLEEADEGKTVQVDATFTDDDGYEETLLSVPTGAIGPRPNRPATGAPTVVGTVQVGETLTVDISDIEDADGLDNVSFSYQWLAGDADIAGATGDTYTLVADDAGLTIQVKVSFFDDKNNQETLTSAATAAVQTQEPNSLPTVTGPTDVDYAENSVSSVATYIAMDPEGEAIEWSVSGTDHVLFSITSGVLELLTPPNYENPIDEGEDNGYLLDVTATDSSGAAVTIAVTVTVTDVYDPNIVLVMADEGGYELFGAYGSTQYRTPRIDEIAAASVRFTHAYSKPGSTPSRVALMTGKSNVRNYVDWGTLLPGEYTIADLFSDAGYATAIAGKWQLQGRPNYITGVAAEESGFDTYCLWYSDISERRYWQPTFECDGQVIDYAALDYGPDKLVDFLDEFIESNQDKPFFAYYSMLLPHAPFDALPPTAQCADADNAQCVFEDMVAYMDYNVGRIYDKLESLGLLDNTVFLFTSDNGTPESKVSHLDGEAIHGEKGEPTDGGTHVPLIVHAPGATGGQVIDDLIDFTDFLPTLADAAGLTLPADVTVDGQSFWDRLQGGSGNLREWIYTYYFPEPYTDRWTFPREHPEVAYVRNKTFKLYASGDLYDLSVDRHEVRPLAEDDEDSHAARAALQAVLDSMPEQGQEIVWNSVLTPPPATEPRPRWRPVLRSATVNGAELSLAYAGGLKTQANPGSDAFSVEVEGTGRTVTSVSLTEEEVTLTLASAVTVGQTVTVSYTLPSEKPLRRKYESKGNKAAALTEEPVRNDTGLAPPTFTATGAPSIGGTAQVGETLTVDTSGIDDEDGLANVSFSYQWLANDAEIAGATDPTYTLVDDDAGLTIKVKVSFFDDENNQETLTSAGTAAVDPDPGPMTGITVVDASDQSVEGALADGGTLALDDPVGGSFGIRADLESGATIGSMSLELTGAKTHDQTENIAPYSLYGDSGGNLSGESLPVGEYTLTATAYSEARLGGNVLGTLKVSFTVTETATQQPNSPATGAPTISGIAQVGETLRADISGIADVDGMSGAVFSYQWLANEVNIDTDIAGATDPTYTLVADDVGKAIRVRVSFTDGASNVETLTSEATATVVTPLTAEFRDAPDKHLGTGVFTFEITFSEPISISYKTLRDDSLEVTNGSATKAKRLNGQSNLWEITIKPDSDADVTVVLPVTGDCTAQDAVCTRDGTKLSNRSELTVPGPAAANSPATGAPIISGTAEVGETLTVDTSGIDDADGMSGAVFSYQWLADGVDIAGATSDTYTLVDADFGKTIKVRVIFNDDDANEETLASEPTAAVAAETAAPDAPQSLNVSPDDTGTLDVSWEAPASDGDSAITGYKVQWKSGSEDYDGSAGSTRQAEITDPASRTHTITGLTDGVEYAVRVIAVNDVGDGPPSDEATGTPRETTPPELATATVDGTTLTLTYDEALDENSEPSSDAFSVTVGGTGRAVDGVSVSGSSVTLTLGSAVASGATVTVSYTAPTDAAAPRIQDEAGNPAASFSDQDVENKTPPPANSPATGAPTISGTAQAGETLTASTSDIDDADGLDNVGYSYQWLANGADIAGATSSSYMLVEADNGKTIQVNVSFRDDRNHQESLTSAATAAVEPRPNSPATGAPTISGTARVGETLTASTSDIDDADGMRGAVFSYQWLADDADIAGATSDTYTLVDADLDKAVKVRVIFTDNADNEETLTSEATAAVEPRPNSPATGAPTISGTVRVGETLTAETSAIADADGLDNVGYSYQWLANGADIAGATSSTYTLVDDDVGKAIKVKVSFRDDRNHQESLTSAATAAVEPRPNSPATGAPTISGTVRVGETLTAETRDIEDADGMSGAVFSYQWLANGADVAGATNETYTPVADDVGKAIKVKVSFRDDRNHQESLTSAATAAVEPRPNSPATGAPTISGTAQVGKTLTADTSGIDDADGMSGAVFSYQWLANGADVAGATNETYTPVADDVDKAIKVKVSFRDDRNHQESLTSAATAAVTAAADDSSIWSATLTVGSIGGFRGFWKDIGMGELTSEVFTLDGVDYTVKVLADSDGPQFYLTLDKALPAGFTLQVGATTLSSQDASIREFSSGATQYGWATNQEAVLADVDTVEVSLTLAE